MTARPMAGRVVIVAGSGSVFVAVTGALVDGEALVAVLTTDTELPQVAAHFRGDPADQDVWARMVPHVEQRLGPIDGAVVDASAQDVALDLVAPDLVRRGHGAVVVVEPQMPADDVLRLLADRL